MRIFACLSWFDESPTHLRRAVTSLKGFADVLVAIDGAYSTFPGGCGASPIQQQWALSDAVRTANLWPYLVTPCEVWASEVEKRATMFHYGRKAGATPDDWFLIIDADMALGEFTPETRDLLANTDRDIAEVRWHNIQIDGVVNAEHRFRSMFRALPGLTVERTHWLYTVPEPDDDKSRGTGRRFLWLYPNGHPSDEPILDLFGHVTLNHFNSSRAPSRRQRALDYYSARDSAGLEAVGNDWLGRGELA